MQLKTVCLCLFGVMGLLRLCICGVAGGMSMTDSDHPFLLKSI